MPQNIDEDPGRPRLPSARGSRNDDRRRDEGAPKRVMRFDWLDRLHLGDGSVRREEPCQRHWSSMESEGRPQACRLPVTGNSVPEFGAREGLRKLRNGFQ